MPKTLDWYADWRAFVCDCVCVCKRANKQEQAVGPLIMLIGPLIANARLVQMEMLLVVVAYT